MLKYLMMRKREKQLKKGIIIIEIMIRKSLKKTKIEIILEEKELPSKQNEINDMKTEYL